MIIDSRFPIKGKLDGLRIWQCGNKTVAAVIKKDAKNPRTESQMRQRIKMNNILDLYKCINHALKENYEGISGNRNAASFFRSYNLMKTPVWLTYRQKLYDQCVLAPYVVGQGKMEPIHYEFGQGVFTTDIEIGEQSVSEETTLAELSHSICGNNENWSHEDSLQIMLLRQKRCMPDLQDLENEGTKELSEIESMILTIPVMTLSGDKLSSLSLNASSTRGFSLGLCNVSGKIAVKIEDQTANDYVYAFAAIHSRGEDYKRLCSTQELLLSDTSMYDCYTSAEALNRALQGYKPKRKR